MPLCVHTCAYIRTYSILPFSPSRSPWSVLWLWLLSIDFFLRYWFRVAQHIPSFFFFLSFCMLYIQQTWFHFFPSIFIHFFRCCCCFSLRFLLFFNAQNSTSHKTCVFAAAAPAGSATPAPLANPLAWILVQRTLLVTEFPFLAESETFC